MKIVKVTTSRVYDSAQMEKLQYLVEKQLGADYKVVLLPNGADATVIDDDDLRDQFAIHAMAAYITANPEAHDERIAGLAYATADAMLEARNANR